MWDEMILASLDFSDAGSINRIEAVVPCAAPATISGGPRWVVTC